MHKYSFHCENMLHFHSFLELVLLLDTQACTINGTCMVEFPCIILRMGVVANLWYVTHKKILFTLFLFLTSIFSLPCMCKTCGLLAVCPTTLN